MFTVGCCLLARYDGISAYETILQYFLMLRSEVRSQVSDLTIHIGVWNFIGQEQGHINIVAYPLVYFLTACSKIYSLILSPYL